MAKAKHAYVANRQVTVDIRVGAKSAMDVDQFMGDLKKMIFKSANVKMREKRHGVMVMSIDIR